MTRRGPLDGERLVGGDLVVDVDLVEHRVADDAPLVLPHVAAPEARVLEHEAVTDVEAMRDRRLDAVEVAERLVEPRVGAAQARVDLLEALHVVVRVRRRARGFVLGLELVEDRR